MGFLTRVCRVSCTGWPNDRSGGQNLHRWGQHGLTDNTDHYNEGGYGRTSVKVDDLQNRARRSNLSLVGLPKSTEGGDVCFFGEVDSWHAWWIQLSGTSTNWKSTSTRQNGMDMDNKDGNQRTVVQPRVVLMKFLNYADKVWIMKATRTKESCLSMIRRLCSPPTFLRICLNGEKLLTQQRKNWLPSPSLTYVTE